MSSDRGRRLAFAVGLLGALAILTVLILQHGFGYAPCPLCLEQRRPYYLGVPLALVLALVPLPRWVLATGLAILVGLFAWGSAIGLYQAGAEWGWWLGPADCGAGNQAAQPAGVGELAAAIQSSTVVSCTDPQLRVLGLSLAGLNAIGAAVLTVLALAGLLPALRRRR